MPTATQTHTPGPWDTDGHCITDSECGRIIAKAGWGEPWIDEPDAVAANARLIAAAPLMLKALEYTIEAHGACTVDPCWCGIPKAAIARAEGR